MTAPAVAELRAAILAAQPGRLAQMTARQAANELVACWPASAEDPAAALGQVLPADLGALEVDEILAYAAELAAVLHRAWSAASARWPGAPATPHQAGDCWCRRRHATIADADAVNQAAGIHTPHRCWCRLVHSTTAAAALTRADAAPSQRPAQV